MLIKALNEQALAELQLFRGSNKTLIFSVFYNRGAAIPEGTSAHSIEAHSLCLWL